MASTDASCMLYLVSAQLHPTQVIPLDIHFHTIWHSRGMPSVYRRWEDAQSISLLGCLQKPINCDKTECYLGAGPCTAEIVTRSQNAYVISCIHCQIEHLPRLAGYSFLAPASALDPLDAQHVLVRAFLGRFAVHADASLCEKLRPSSIVVLCSERSRNA